MQVGFLLVLFSVFLPLEKLAEYRFLIQKQIHVSLVLKKGQM